jgi:hypothetical protein
MTDSPSRLLSDCPAVIFIAYTVGQDAVERGYCPWLVETDNPFFNAIPGVHHYANWRVEGVDKGGPLSWDWFDFQGLSSESELEQVWFNPDLDAFRKEWIRLWGYGKQEPPPVLRHAYLMRPTRPATGVPATTARLCGGRGPAPAGADQVFVVTEVLAKHFAGVGAQNWKWPAAQGNPLGLDWLALDYAPAAAPAPSHADIVLASSLVAAP